MIPRGLKVGKVTTVLQNNSSGIVFCVLIQKMPYKYKVVFVIMLGDGAVVADIAVHCSNSSR